MNSVLITGATGFIGKNLCEAIGSRAIIYEGDITNEIINKDNPSVVVHLAGISNNQVDKEAINRVNVLGTKNVIEFCIKNEVNKLIFSSTSGVYGNPPHLPVKETDPINPINNYSISKAMAEEEIRKQAKVNCIILRLANVYGPGDNNKERLFPSIVNGIKNEKISISNLKSRRDFIFISDVISAIVKSIESDIDGCSIINIGSGLSYSVEEILNKFLELIGENIPVELSSNKKDIINDIYLDNSRAKEIIGWTPETPLNDAIGRIVSGISLKKDP